MARCIVLACLEPPGVFGIDLEPPELSPPGPQANGRPLVVVADDDQSIRALFAATLEREGFAVLLASNGRKAMDLARNRPVVAMLLDLHMPDLDGLETLRELREDPSLRTIPVIVVTGSTAEADRVAGLEGGADDVVVKPVSVTELVARVRAQIRGRAALARDREADREHRRRLATILSELPREAPLLALATELTQRLPPALTVDGVAILAFERGSTRVIASSGVLQDRYPPTKLLAQDVGAQIALQAGTGPWLDTPIAPRERSGRSLQLAFVPFSLAAGAAAIGCLVYGIQTTAASGPLSYRLAELIDATDLIVATLRPAIEHAETTNAAILELRRIISRKRFDIYLQPISRLDDGLVIGVEALTRFEDGTRPDIRFAEAARLGMGAPLERATLSTAIETASALPKEVALSVNISPDVLQHDRSIREIIAGAERPVIVELTEHERIDDYDAVRAAFARLGPNTRLAVDDAGSGYASLRHILALNPSFVKLDMAWVRGIHLDPVRRSLVSGLAYFAGATGCQLIAEGIESEEERRSLLELGVRLGQGFLLGRPAPIESAPRPVSR
jgi:EAL domain-containing protein (putative c-di-GMP-specific phosphodiesterase class I)/DNA-binding NarL/FixJ family response regulator